MATTSPVAIPRPRLLHVAVLLLAAQASQGATRRHVYALVQKHPGLHQRDLARRMGIAEATAEHHLRHLVRAGLLTRVRQGGHVRYWVTVQGAAVPEGVVRPDDRPKLGVLRKARPLEIVANLLTEGPVTMGRLAGLVALSAGTLTHHVDRLESAGLVRRRQDGRERLVELVDREDTIRILLAYEPPADLVAGFQDLWDGVGL